MKFIQSVFVLFALLCSAGVTRADEFPYVAIVRCGINQPPNLCFGAGFDGDKSFIDFTNGGVRKVFAWNQINQIGQNTKDGLGILLRNNFSLIMRNVNPNVNLTLTIHDRETRKILFQQSAAHNETISISN